MTGATPCLNSISASVLDGFVTEKLLEAMSPAGVDLSLQVIEDEVTRRTQLDTLYGHRVQQAQCAQDIPQRRYKEVDPANRLVAASLERDWEAAMLSLQAATHELDELRSAQPVQLSDVQREHLLSACGSVTSLWHSRATIEERKQITRLLLQKVAVQVLNNSERVSVRLHWSGGFESCHDLATGESVLSAGFLRGSPRTNALAVVAGAQQSGDCRHPCEGAVCLSTIDGTGVEIHGKEAA